MNRKKVIAAAIVVAVSIGTVIALLQPRPEMPNDGGTVIANATEPAETVNVVSARSAFPFVQRCVSQYNNDESALANIEISYDLERPDSLSDLMIVGDIRHANGSQSIPVSAQAVAIVYNIPSFPDIPSGMKLNASLLSLILDGTITKWDDPAIKSLNKDLNLPAEKIILIYEKGNTSSLALLERYIANELRWPSHSTGVLGPDELASMVRKTPYSIGYVDFSYAIQTRMTFAAIANPHGEYVLPSIDSIGQAVNSSMVVRNVTEVITPPFINTSMFGNSSYPLTGLYLAAFSDNASDATLDFVRWIIDKNGGQQVLSEVQYPPIYRDNELLIAYAKVVTKS